MGKFINELVEIDKRAKEFILSKIPIGESMLLSSSGEEFEGDEDEFYDLPVCYTVGKYDTYNEYGIVKVEHTKDNGLLFHTLGKSEGSEPKRVFDTSEIIGDVLCAVADLIEEIQK